MPGPSERFEFPGHEGQMLAARLDKPNGKPVAYAVFAHCFTCSKDVAAAGRISRMLAEQGIAVLRFDFTGLGHSEGEFENTNFSSNKQDLIAAANYLRQNLQAPKLLIGHSLGGAAVLAAAKHIPEALIVATIGAPCEPAHVKHLLKTAQDDIDKNGVGDIELGGRTFKIQKQFLDDIHAHKMSEAIANLGKALVIFHSPQDTVVEIDNARHIYQTAKHPKSFISLDDADHMLSRKSDAIFVSQILAAWTAKYLPRMEDVRVDGADETGHGEVRVTEVLGEKLANDIVAEGHHLRADEPEDKGGGNTGPAPYGLLLSSLGACTSMTLRLYADHKEWPLERVVVKLRHEKVHAADVPESSSDTGLVDRIEREIELQGPLDDEQRKRLLEIANKCPVHRTLHAEVFVESKLVG
ncbi:alpha/beta fold hydrolase [bacterium]|nr:alpha/beta fold hydrolase [bacterium]